MRLALRINTRNGSRRLELMVESLRDLDPILSDFGKYLRERSKQRFAQQGPGWKPSAESTKQRLGKKLLGRITKGGGRVKVTGRIQRFERSLPEEVKYELAMASRKTGGSKLAAAVRKAALMKPHERELLNIASEIDRSATRKRRSSRNALKKHRLLGRLPTSLAVKISRGVLQVYSKVPWSGVHNVGGTAGKGSKIPARTFLRLEPEDMDVFETMLRKRALLAFGG